MKKGKGRRSWSSPPKSSSSGGGDDWLMTYADSITLLMAFFVMMFSISKLDHEKFIEITTAIEKELGHRDPGTQMSPNQGADAERVDQSENEAAKTAAEIDSKMEELRDFMTTLKTEGIMLEQQPSGFEIELSSKLLYVSGSAELRKEVRGVLTNVGNMLKGLETDEYQIEIQGHTDSAPINSSRYASNWELSAARATGVVRFFIDQGMSSSQLRAIAFADTQPKMQLANPNEPGAADVAALNRRVVIRVTYVGDDLP